MMLLLNTQLKTEALTDSHNTPPPFSADPLLNVNPDKLAPLVKYTHRFD